jgi:hypothetical protein
MWWLLAVAPAAAALYGLHRLALWAEGRDWIYYRRRRMPPGSAGMAFLEVTSVLHPAVEHVIEQTRTQQACAAQDESGEGPAPLGE